MINWLNQNWPVAIIIGIALGVGIWCIIVNRHTLWELIKSFPANVGEFLQEGSHNFNMKIGSIYVVCFIILGAVVYYICDRMSGRIERMESRVVSVEDFVSKQKAENNKFETALKDHQRTLIEYANNANELKKSYDQFVIDHDRYVKGVAENVILMKRQIDSQIAEVKFQVSELNGKFNKESSVSVTRFDELNEMLMHLLNKREKADEMLAALQAGAQIEEISGDLQELAYAGPAGIEKEKSDKTFLRRINPKGEVEIFTSGKWVSANKAIQLAVNIPNDSPCVTSVATSEGWEYVGEPMPVQPVQSEDEITLGPIAQETDSVQVHAVPSVDTQDETVRVEMSMPKNEIRGSLIDKEIEIGDPPIHRYPYK